MTLYFKIKRRVLNGFALKYTLKEIIKVLLGYINSKKVPQHIKVQKIEIDLRKIPCFIISLNFRLDRRKKIISLLNNKLKYQFVNAIHGKCLNLSEVPKELFSIKSKRYLSTGSIGCILSHLKAWQFAEKAGCKTSLFLEDDIEMKVDVDLINELLKQAPHDFDIIFLGSSSKNPLRANKNINDYFFEVIYPRKGMFAYILNINSLQEIYKNIFPVTICAGGIDTLIGRLVLDGKLMAYHFNLEVIYANRLLSSNIINPSDNNKIIHYKEYI